MGDNLERLQEAINLSQKAVGQLQEQMDLMNRSLDLTINNLQGEEREKINLLKGMVNKAITRAKNGGDYDEVIDDIKNKFKNDIKNGGRGNEQNI